MNIAGSSIFFLNGVAVRTVAGRGRAELLETGRVVRRSQAQRFDGCRAYVGAPAFDAAPADLDGMLSS
jgi:hypothetical protein